uniref:Homeobox-leucine zipper protein n=1 Tax=Opuntia streptacantha TaxID=393608 RepID=A0A7C9DFM0_OPUST
MKMGKRKRTSVSYSEELQAMLERIHEDYYALDKGEQASMRKNRLYIEQVKGLEKHFEEENRLQSGRKVKIAEELGLEPRQVAIWFQNRRARSKTKKLESDYDELRAGFDALKHSYRSLEQERNVLLSQVKELKARIETMEKTTVESSSTSLLTNPMPSSSASCLDDGYDESVWMEEMLGVMFTGNFN